MRDRVPTDIQCLILWGLKDGPRTVRQFQDFLASEHWNHTDSAFHQLMERIIKLGWVKPQFNENDGLRVYLLTSKGKTALRSAVEFYGRFA